MIFKKGLSEITLRNEKYRFLLSVDPSLTCSGWALFDIQNESLLAVGKIRSLKPSCPLAIRLSNLQTKIEKTYKKLQIGEKDVVICESPTTVMDPNALIKVEQVRSMFEVLARTIGAVVPGRIHPRSVQSELMELSGHQQARKFVKLSAIELVKKIYLLSLKKLKFPIQKLSIHQDIVDALLLGRLALSRCQSAKLTKMPLENYFELNAKKRDHWSITELKKRHKFY